MKSESGVTLSSLIIYVIAMSIIIGTIAVITNYFYGNINGLTNRTKASKQYTEFNSYFVNEVNKKGNTVLTNLLNADDEIKIVFSSGNKFTFVKNAGSENGAIYFNKIKICKEVTSCSFSVSGENNIIEVTMQINGKTFKNEYTIQND